MSRRLEAQERLIRLVIDNLKPSADAEQVTTIMLMTMADMHSAGLEDAEFIARNVVTAGGGKVALVIADAIAELNRRNKRDDTLQFGIAPA